MDTSLTTTPNAGTDRSSFITSLAWIFIVLAGFGTAVTLLQNIMIMLVFPFDEMQASIRETGRGQSMPWFARLMFDNVRLMVGSIFCICVLTLVSAIGLLKRKNWARLVFIGIIGLGILYNIASALMPLLIFPSIPEAPQGAPPDIQGNFELMTEIMTGFIIAISTAFVALFGWIMKRFFSKEIKREFMAL